MESKVKSSEVTIAWLGKADVWDMATGAVVVVTGLNCKGRAEGLANIWKEGNDMLFK